MQFAYKHFWLLSCYNNLLKLHFEVCVP